MNAYTPVAGAKQPRKISEKDISSLTAEVAQYKNSGIIMAQQIAALREDNQKLRDDISICTSRTDELQQSQHSLSVDLGSARHELGVKASLIERRDRMITSLTTEVAQLKKTNVEKTKQIATLRQDCADLQERCSAQAVEILSLGNDLGSDASLPVEEKCVGILEGMGDAALNSGKHEEAIACYSSALSLNPAHAVGILLKRSTARASKGSWEDALTDAVEVCVLCYI